MNEQEFNDFLAELRACGDGKAGLAIRQCRLLAPFAGDEHKAFRSEVASGLEMTPQGVSNWARAGSVLEAGIFEDEADQRIGFYAEVGRWRRDQWQEVAEFSIAGGLDAAGLGAVRKLAANLAGTDVQSCLVCGDAMLEWAKRLYQEVEERDDALCVNCGAAMWEVHHIVPRSRGKSMSRKLWRVENLCCICRTCHTDGQTDWMRQKLLKIVADRYGYDMRWVQEFGIAWETADAAIPA